MQVRELATGLWYWTGRHPALDAGGRRPGRVGAGGRLLLLRRAGRDLPLRPADPDGGPRPVLRGARPRRRAGWEARADPAHGRCAPAQRGRPRGAATASIRRRYRRSGPTGRRGRDRGGAAGEFVFWMPEHRALVAGDLIIGRAHGLEVPRPWLGGPLRGGGRAATAAARPAGRPRARHARRARARGRARGAGESSSSRPGPRRARAARRTPSTTRRGRASRCTRPCSRRRRRPLDVRPAGGLDVRRRAAGSPSSCAPGGSRARPGPAGRGTASRPGRSLSKKCATIRFTSGSTRMYSGARPPGMTTPT